MGTPYVLLGLLRKFVKGAAVGVAAGVTVADRFGSVVRLNGRSMQPTFNPEDSGFPSKDIVLVEKFCLRSFAFSRGDVVAFRSPQDPKEYLVKRLIALQEDWVTVPGTYEILQIPKGHCWVEGDNVDVSLDSKEFGPIPLALMRGRVTHVVWPPERFGPVENKYPTGRVFSGKDGRR
ncbi:hypothetical protein R1sor_005348 [Riccia sorocarpa]|uniref:Mitochondrial inner membrane protease subunit 2 n=1 Tax=Riccia sorocarpa TaxID=122646 RepID=A0ABD3HJI6_9MARC